METKITLGPVAVSKVRECATSIGSSYERMYKECLREGWKVWRSGDSCTISVSVKADEVWCSGPLLSKSQKYSIARTWDGLFGVVLSCNGNSMTFSELLQLTDINPQQLSNAKSRVLSSEKAAQEAALMQAQKNYHDGLSEVHEGSRKKIKALQTLKAASEARLLAARTAFSANEEEVQELRTASRRAVAANAEEVWTIMHVSRMCAYELLSHSRVTDLLINNVFGRSLMILMIEPPP